MDDITEEVDYDAIHRLWPPGTQYGQAGTWFAYVGRTRPQRNAMMPLRVKRGPRGRIVHRHAGIRTRSTFAGEFEAKTLRNGEGA